MRSRQDRSKHHRSSGDVQGTHYTRVWQETGKLIAVEVFSFYSAVDLWASPGVRVIRQGRQTHALGSFSLALSLQISPC
jgi:hypothetical protein